MSGVEARKSKHANSLSYCPSCALEPAMVADAYRCRWMAVHAHVPGLSNAAARRRAPPLAMLVWRSRSAVLRIRMRY
eukprot:3809466-Pleurochrysis_carterae.AAC.1